MALMMVTPVGAKHKNFKVSVYVRAAEVQKMKDQKWLDESWATISSQLDVDKIYLETHRDLLIVDDATIEKAKKFFQTVEGKLEDYYVGWHKKNATKFAVSLKPHSYMAFSYE